MAYPEWVKEFPGAVTVCAEDGTILAMNDRSAETFKADGGRALIGKNLLDCHSEASREKVHRLLASHEKNVYTIEKHGMKKLIYQSPWYENGEYRGLVELSLELPTDLPHFIRD
jgi:transcriptional regulator with PAS, ATPase and Fis domain